MSGINNKIAIKRICLTALCIGLAALCKLFTLNVTFFGESGIKIGLSGIFTSLPAFLFGPVYGGIASACSDISGVIIAPTGAYNPLFTLSAFAGGYIKGFVWRALSKSNRVKLRVILSSFFAVILAVGIMFYAFLAGDGIVNGVLASTETMPQKSEIVNGDISFISSLITDRVKSTDTLTITDITCRSTLYISGPVTENGVKYNIAIGQTAFDNCTSLKDLYIEDGVKSIVISDSLKSLGVTIHLTENAKCYNTVKESGISYVTEESLEDAKAQSMTDSYIPTISYTSNDTYRKNLAMYVNFATFVLCLVGVLGLALTLAELIISKAKNLNMDGVRVYSAIFSAEIIVTTLNTVILKEMTMADTWASYPFLIVWIPRAIEGVFVCMIQAYIIVVLIKVMKKALTGVDLGIRNDII